MKTYVQNEDGSAIICAMGTILILSIIGANVLMNCTTRYNVTSKQVSAWRNAKRLQIRRCNLPGQAGAARIVPLDRGLIPCPLLLAGPATFWRPLRLTPCRVAACRLWTVAIATIGFIPL